MSIRWLVPSAAASSRSEMSPMPRPVRYSSARSRSCCRAGALSEDMNRMVHVPYGSPLDRRWRTTGMHFETRIEIAAAREQVWATLIDVERWHDWTKSVTGIELLTGAPLSASLRVRIKQPRLKALEWDVTEFVPNEMFNWTSSTFGI